MREKKYIFSQNEGHNFVLDFNQLQDKPVKHSISNDTAMTESPGR